MSRAENGPPTPKLSRRPLILDYTHPSDQSRSPQSMPAIDCTTGSQGEGSLSGPSAHSYKVKRDKIDNGSVESDSREKQHSGNGDDVLKNFKNQSVNSVKVCETSVQTDLSIPTHGTNTEVFDDSKNGSSSKQPGNQQQNTAQKMQSTLEFDTMQKRNLELEAKIVNLGNDLKTSDRRLTNSLEITKKLLIEKCELEKKRAQVKCSENSIILGQFVMQRYGSSYKEVWQTGSKIRSLLKRQKQIVREREDLEKQKKHLTKNKASITSSIQTIITANSINSNSCQSSSSISGEAASFQAENKKLMEICELEEMIKLKQYSLRKEDNETNLDIERVERERLIHAREIKRLQNQDNSRFNDYPILNSRYLVLEMIGKGGFSEVHKAFDLQEQRYVACKIHQLNRDWKEERKVNYIRHAVREYDIHKKLAHPRIVKLYDVFEIDNNTFCTVLEYCNGPDLDFQLKQNHTLPEREARAIICQVVSALKYLNEMAKPIIHYDLKPANILLALKEDYRELLKSYMGSSESNNASASSAAKSEFEKPHSVTWKSNGESAAGKMHNFFDDPIASPLDIKITDFGLSKIVDRQSDSGPAVIDLTSQGAGTYWYLPPETFAIGSTPPKISSKVDVWSVGVIFYQMLYGEKPFAHNMSQTAIIEQNAIQKQAAHELKFPSKPQCSQEAKNLIKQCLIYDVDLRPDVITLASNEYLRPSNYKARTFPDNGS